MADAEPLWLVYNRASGSNDDESLAALKASLENAGFCIAGLTCFPDEDFPDAGQIEAKGAQVLAVFAGDGTVHAVVTSLFGWSGRIIVLPGGTKNLLSKRLHGVDANAGEIVTRIGAGGGHAVRPPILETREGFALSGALAGPGAEWNNVREAIRHAAIGEVAVATVGAAADSVGGERVACRGLEDVHPEGYAAISITPEAEGIAVNGYFADRVGDYLGQVAALLQGDFRKGPHDVLGVFPSVEIYSLDGQPLGMLFDGEPRDGEPCETFRLTACKVDLVATREPV